jgi:hypothetical protein
VDDAESASRLPREVACAPFLDGLVLHQACTGRLFRLNRTAARAWPPLRAGVPEEAIARELARFDTTVDPKAVRRDLAAFAVAARRAGLLGADEPRDDVEAPPAPEGRPALDAAYRVGEAVVRVACHPADVAAAFAPLAAPAAAPGEGGRSRLTLFRDRGGFVLARDGRLAGRATTAPAARWALVRELIRAGARLPWLALLHAGAAAVPARGCLLLCGGSGAGKSTLLAGLLHAGLGLVADDVLPLEASGLVRPVRLAISVKRGSWPVVGAMFPELADAPSVRFGGRVMRHLWPERHAVAGGGLPSAAVLFPRYAAGAPVSLVPLDPVRALVLLGEGGSVLPDTDAGLAEFLAWLGRVPAYALAYGRLDEAVREVRALTEVSRVAPGRPPGSVVGSKVGGGDA